MGRIAEILQARGQLDEALRIYQEEALPVYERLGDVRSKAVAMGQIADILQAQGQLDEALRIHQEEALPVYERLGDVRAKAFTMGRIADIMKRTPRMIASIIHQGIPALRSLFSVSTSRAIISAASASRLFPNSLVSTSKPSILLPAWRL
jgi:tetratricopeptide (TPR) repeat protein